MREVDLYKRSKRHIVCLLARYFFSRFPRAFPSVRVALSAIFISARLILAEGETRRVKRSDEKFGRYEWYDSRYSLAASHIQNRPTFRISVAFAFAWPFEQKSNIVNMRGRLRKNVSLDGARCKRKRLSS